LSTIEQFLAWTRYKGFMKKSKMKQFFDYIAVISVDYVIPPKPLGLYYRFLLTKKLFKSKIKEIAILIIIDTFFEALAITSFALIALFVFPKANLGLAILLYLLAGIGILYFVFSYYETRVYLIKNNLIRKIVKYFSKIKTEFLKSFYSLLKLKKSYLVVGLILSIIKMFIGVLKVYLLFSFFGLNVPFWICFGMWSIAYFIGSSSSLPGGLGAFELSFVFLAKSINIPGELALNVAIVERFFNIWVWFIFTIIYLFVKKIKILMTHKTFLRNMSKLVSKIYSKSKLKNKANKNKIIKTKI